MVFIDSLLPLPTRPLVNSTFTYNTDIVQDSKQTEQRIPKRSEYRLTLDLSDVTFTEEEMITFLDFFRTSLNGKLNSFRFKCPVEYLVTAEPKLLNDVGTIYSYGRLIPIEDNKVNPNSPNSGQGYTLYQAIKVYEILNANTSFRTIKTLNKINTEYAPLEIFNLTGAPLVDPDIFVDHNNGQYLIRTTLTSNQPLAFSGGYDHEVRLEVDSIPQITLALRPEGQTSGCDRYKFDSLNLIEVLGFKINPYNPYVMLGAIGQGQDILFASSFQEVIPFSPVIFQEFDVNLRPLETLEYQFNTKVFSINDFESRVSYSDNDRFRGTFDATRVYQDEAEKINCFFQVMKGRSSLFPVTFRNEAQQIGRFDSDEITFTQLTDIQDINPSDFFKESPKSRLYSLESLSFYAASFSDPIDFSDNNVIADTTGTPKLSLNFEDVGIGFFDTNIDIQFLGLATSLDNSLEHPLITVIQKTDGSVIINDGGWGNDPLKQSVTLPDINGRLGIDSPIVTFMTDDDALVAFATDGDVVILNKSNLAVVSYTGTAEQIHDENLGATGLDARITNLYTSENSAIHIATRIDDEIRTSRHQNGVVESRDREDVSNNATFIFSTSDDFHLFYDPAANNIRYKKSGTVEVITNTPSLGGTFTRSHEVHSSSKSQNLFSAITSSNAPLDAGMVVGSARPTQITYSSLGGDVEVADQINIPNFGNLSRLLNISGVLLPQGGLVAQVFDPSINDVTSLNGLIDDDSPLQLGDMPTQEYYAGTVVTGGIGYSFRPGATTPSAPYRLNDDFILTRVRSELKLVKEVEQPFLIPPLSVESSLSVIDFTDPSDPTLVNLGDPNTFYSGTEKQGVSSTPLPELSQTSQLSVQQFSNVSVSSDLPAGSPPTTVWTNRAVFYAAGTLWLIKSSSGGVNNWRNRIAFYKVVDPWTFVFDAALTNASLDYTFSINNYNTSSLTVYAVEDAVAFLSQAVFDPINSFTGRANTLGTYIIKWSNSGLIETAYSEHPIDPGVSTFPSIRGTRGNDVYTTSAGATVPEGSQYFTILGLNYIYSGSSNGSAYIGSGSTQSVVPDNLWIDAVFRDFKVTHNQQSTPVTEINCVSTNTTLSTSNINNSSMVVVRASQVCEQGTLGDSACPTTRINLTYRFLQPSPGDDYTLIDVENTTGLITPALFTQAAGQRSRIDKLGNMITISNNQIYYYAAGTGYSLNVTTLIGGGNTLSIPTESPWGFLIPRPLGNNVNLYILQPQLIVEE